MSASYSSLFGRLRFGLARRVLYLWARSRRIGDDDTIDPQRPVIYVLPYRSLSDLIVADRECVRAGLPRPVRAPLPPLDERESYVFLNHQRSWVGRPDPRSQSPRLGKVLDCALDDAASVQLVPITVFWGQSPDSESSPLKLLFAWNWMGGRLRKFLAILLQGRKVRVHFGPQVPLQTLLEPGMDQQRAVRRVNRVLRVHFRQQRAAVVGPELVHRSTLLKGLLHAPLVRAAIAQEASEKGIDERKAQAMAARYANEIASDFTYTIIRFLEVVLSWFWNKLYDGIRVNNLKPIQDIARGNEIIYVPCHRSHIDYLLDETLVLIGCSIVRVSIPLIRISRIGIFAKTR